MDIDSLLPFPPPPKLRRLPRIYVPIPLSQWPKPPVKREVIPCYSPVSNRKCRDAAAELMAGGFCLFLEQVGRDGFFPNPNYDERKHILRHWNLLPLEYNSEDDERTALMWVRKFYVQHYVRRITKQTTITEGCWF